MVFFLQASFWNTIVFFALLLTWFGLIVCLVLYAAYRLYYRYDAGVYIEKTSGVIYKSTRARIWVENGIKRIKLFWLKHKTHPAPTLDAIMPGNRGNRIEYLVDVYGNLHQIRPKTRFLPVLIDDDGELKQLRQEQPDVAERKKGWFSKLKNMFVREVTTYDQKTGKEKKEVIGIYEVAMEVDNTVDKAWAFQELVNNFNKHITSTWDKYKGPIVIGSIVIFGIIALFLTGYFTMKISEKTVMQCGSDSAKAIGEALAQRLGVVGLGPVNQSEPKGVVIAGSPIMGSITSAIKGVT